MRGYSANKGWVILFNKLFNLYNSNTTIFSQSLFRESRTLHAWWGASISFGTNLQFNLSGQSVFFFVFRGIVSFNVGDKYEKCRPGNHSFNKKQLCNIGLLRSLSRRAQSISFPWSWRWMRLLINCEAGWIGRGWLWETLWPLQLNSLDPLSNIVVRGMKYYARHS